MTDDPILPKFVHQMERIRSCVAWSLAAVFVPFVVGFLLAPQLFEVLVEPLKSRLQPGQSLIGTGVAEVFFVEIKVAFLAGVLAGSPVIFLQSWRMVAPAFGAEGKTRYMVGFVSATTVFFLSGALFCYQAVLPVAFLYFLDQYGSLQVNPEIRVSEYFSFFFRIVVAFGVTFQLPVFSFFLARAGIWNHRFLWHHFRYAVLVMFVLAAVLTPPDVVSQVLLAGPLIALYLLSIGVAYIFGRKP
ncbi:MAG: twin-arginine translocase subunit TatC [Deltaproteobacteria bacterium]|nr:twin-arginine translocase subunit TatC [Deltaproteobacteria bacterium]